MLLLHSLLIAWLSPHGDYIHRICHVEHYLCIAHLAILTHLLICECADRCRLRFAHDVLIQSIGVTLHLEDVLRIIGEALAHYLCNLLHVCRIAVDEVIISICPLIHEVCVELALLVWRVVVNLLEHGLKCPIGSIYSSVYSRTLACHPIISLTLTTRLLATDSTNTHTAYLNLVLLLLCVPIA